MKPNRVVYLDFLRIIATIAVILLHTAASQWSKISVDSYNWQVFNIYDSFVRWCVPMFLMISGVFFLDNTKSISRKDIYHKYIKRIVLALIFWGLLYGFISLFARSFIKNVTIVPFDILKIFAKIIIGPPWYHLWFLYLIIGIYMLTPLFRIFISGSKKEDIEYLLILFLLLGLLLPTINKILENLNPKININFSVLELTGYAGYFFAGYYFNRYGITKKYKYIIYLLGFLSVIITIIITAKWSLWTNTPQGFLYGYLLPTTMFETYAVFLLLKDIVNSVSHSERFEKYVVYLSSCSFGIYLIHDFIIQAYSIVGITTTTFNPIIMIPLMSIINLICSLLVISLLRKIPFVKKYII